MRRQFYLIQLTWLRSPFLCILTELIGITWSYMTSYFESLIFDAASWLWIRTLTMAFHGTCFPCSMLIFDPGSSCNSCRFGSVVPVWLLYTHCRPWLRVDLLRLYRLKGCILTVFVHDVFGPDNSPTLCMYFAVLDWPVSNVVDQFPWYEPSSLHVDCWDSMQRRSRFSYSLAEYLYWLGVHFWFDAILDQSNVHG